MMVEPALPCERAVDEIGGQRRDRGADSATDRAGQQHVGERVRRLDAQEHVVRDRSRVGTARGLHAAWRGPAPASHHPDLAPDGGHAPSGTISVAQPGARVSRARAPWDRTTRSGRAGPRRRQSGDRARRRPSRPGYPRRSPTVRPAGRPSSPAGLLRMAASSRKRDLLHVPPLALAERRRPGREAIAGWRSPRPSRGRAAGGPTRAGQGACRPISASVTATTSARRLCAR